MLFYRHILRNKRTEKRINKSIVEELSVKCRLLKEKVKKTFRYVGYANRSKHEHLMSTTLQGKVEGKRWKGIPPISFIVNLKDESGVPQSPIDHYRQQRHM